MRFLLLCALLASAGGAGVWYLLPASSCPDCEISASSCANPQPLEVARFTLTKADLALDRERPALAASPEGMVLIACNSRTQEDTNTILVAVSHDRGLSFSNPRPVCTIPVHRHMMKMGGQDRLMESQPLPRLAWGGGKFHLAWCEPGDKDSPRLVVCSTTDGATFSEPVPLHGNEVRKIHYTALAAGSDGQLLAAWLDNRGSGQQPFASYRHSSETPVSMRVDAGTNGKGICPCCDMETMISNSGDAWVAYRHSVDGCRDIHLARRPKGADSFQLLGPASERRWKFQSCPHDGPSLAQTSTSIHVAWMDAADQKRQVFVASGAPETMPWAAKQLPTVKDGEQSQPRLAATGDALGAVWLESFLEDGTRRTVVVSSFSNSRAGSWAEARTVSELTGSPTRPSAVIDPVSGMLVAWFEQGETCRSMVVRRVLPGSSGACCCD